MSDKTGRGNFVPRVFTFKTVDGVEKTWVGRGRFPAELTAVIAAEKAAGVTVTADALAAHRKNKPTGNPVGRPKGSVNKTDVKAMAAETVTKAD